MRWVLGLVVLLMLAVVAPASLAAPTAVPSGAPPACTNIDPYHTTAALRATCGIQASPLLSVTNRTDGGLEYHYEVGEVAITLPVPPAGFDAATASQSEREAYGIPPEPPSSEASAHALWEEMIHNYHVVTPAEAIYTVGSPTAVFNSAESENWSGYVDEGSKGSYNATGIIYDEPSTAPTCYGAASSLWTGLGGYGTTPLDQAGTQLGHGFSVAEHQAWFEIYPQEAEMAVNLYATPGYAFEVTLSHEGGNEVKGLAYNFHTGESVPLSGVSSETYSGASAEYIAERPGTSGGLAPLADYGQWDVIEAWANGNHTLGPWAFKNTALNIVESGTLLSETSGLSSQESGREFYTTWHGYNHANGSTCPSPPDPPKVAAQTPRNITRTTAELAAQVYPGKYETGYYFEYGRTTGYGSRVPTSGEYHLSPAESWDQIYTPVSGLASCSTYDFRIVATNIYGESVDGPNEELTTQCKPPKATTYPATEITRTTAKLEAQVYPNGVSTEYYFSYNEVGGSPKSTVKEYVGSNEEWHWVDKVVSGLKSCTPYEVTVFAENADGEKRAENTELFETECWPPKATTTAAKEVKRTSAELKGEVYPNGLKTEYWFEYSKSGAEFKKTSVLEAGSNDAWHSEHTTVTLESCVEYQFRVVAENEDSRNEHAPGGVVDGETKYFETKCRPLIQGLKTSEPKPGSAVLNAEVNPQEAETTYHFEYDTREYKTGEGGHGTSVPVTAASIGSGPPL